MAPNRSNVWLYFSRENSKEVLCRLCSKKLKSCNNTTNMIQHLKLKHPKQANGLKLAPRNIQVLLKDDELPSTTKNTALNCDQPEKTSTMSHGQTFQSNGSKNQKLTQSIVQMIVMDNLPLSHVEGKGFLQLMKEQFPLYKVPSINTVKAKIDQMYSKEAENFKTMLSHVSYICLSIDMWTNIEMNSMLAITAHGLFENKKICGTIGVFKLTEAHTATDISDVLNSSLLEFGINKINVIAVVADTDPNIVKAINNTFGKDRHIPCFAHALNLVYERSVNAPEINSIIGRCRTIVAWFKQHVDATDSLKHLQISAGIPDDNVLQLILDVKIRWNSTYHMLDRFIKLFEYVTQILKTFTDAPPIIPTKNKDEIIEIISLLRYLEAMTTQISGEKYATLSQIIPLAHCGRKQIMNVVCQSLVANKLKTTILKEFDRQFNQLEHSFLTAAATLLDPRFKSINFQDTIALSAIIRKIRNEIAEIAEVEHKIENLNETAACGEAEFDFWAPHKSLACKRKKDADDCDQSQDELHFFLKTAVLELNRDALMAWDEMKAVYPQLYLLSRKYAFLIGTSLPSERLFSKTGAIATEWRHRLTTTRISKLLFLNSILNK